MKWGEIWARRKRSSACTARRRDRSSSASSSWVDTNCATSLHRRRRPAGAAGSRTASAPTMLPSVVSGTTTPEASSQKFRSPQFRSSTVSTRGRPALKAARIGAAKRARWAASMPSVARIPSTSAISQTSRAEEVPKVGDGPLGRALVEAGPECGGGEVGRVQRHVRSPLHGRPEPALTAEGEPRHRRDQEHNGDQGQPQGLFHATPRKNTSQMSDLLSVPLCSLQCATEGPPSARWRRREPPVSSADAVRRSKRTARRCTRSLRRPRLVRAPARVPTMPVSARMRSTQTKGGSRGYAT